MTAVTDLGHGRVVRLAVPLIISNVSVPLLGLVDTAVIGHLDDARYLGAVAIGSMLFSVVVWGMGFLKMSTSGLTAQAFGDPRRPSSDPLLHGLVMAALLGLILLPSSQLLWWGGLWWFDSAPEVESLAAEYLSIRSWAIAPTLCNLVLVGWLIGVQRTRLPLVILLVANGLNIILDLLLVVVWELGVAGVAWASVVGEWVACLTGLALVLDRQMIHRWRQSGRRIIGRAPWKAIVSLNRDILIRTLLLIAVFLAMTWQSARLGLTLLATHAVLMNFQHLMAYSLDGFAHAAEALVGRAIGQGSNEALRRSIRLTALWSGAVALVFSVAYLLLATPLIAVMTGLPEVRSEAQSLLPWIVMTPLVSCWSFWLDGVFVGATQGRLMRQGMLISAIGFGISLWLSQPLGYVGVWLSFLVFMALRALTLGRCLPSLIAEQSSARS